MTSHDYIGASYERGDGYEKARGLAIYGTDVTVPKMLHAKILRSPAPHAMIRNINVEKAKRLKGVHAVVTGLDYPDSRWGAHLADQTIYGVDRVRYVGEAVAGVAAVDEDTAQEAMELMEQLQAQVIPLRSRSALLLLLASHWLFAGRGGTRPERLR